MKEVLLAQDVADLTALWSAVASAARRQSRVAATATFPAQALLSKPRK
jgi:hypothetical protein